MSQQNAVVIQRPKWPIQRPGIFVNDAGAVAGAGRPRALQANGGDAACQAIDGDVITVPDLVEQFADCLRGVRLADSDQQRRGNCATEFAFGF